MGTRVGPAALHAVQVFLLGVVLMPLGSFILCSIFAPMVLIPLCNNDATQQRLFTHRQRAMMPFNLAAALVWHVYFLAAFLIQPFALLAYELLRLCLPSTRIVPDDTHGGSHSAPSSEAVMDEDLEQATGSIRRSNTGRLLPAAVRAASTVTLLQRQVQQQRNRYIGFESVWAALEGQDGAVRAGDVRLVSLVWLMGLAEKGGTLPRRQDLPEEAFLDTTKLKAIQANARRGYSEMIFADHFYALMEGKDVLKNFFRLFATLCGCNNQRNADKLLPIIAISYCWLEAAHPDREGRQLKLMCERLKALYGGRGLLGACRDYGFSDMGVFLDWASIYQKNPALFDPKETPEAKSEAQPTMEAHVSLYGGEQYAKSRSDDEQAAFGRALKWTMDLWYAHAGITVVMLTKLPDGDKNQMRSYESRGWTTFERCSAELAKNFKLSVAKWKLVIDTGATDGDLQRRLPTAPERMAKLLEARQFTNGADKAMVLDLYTKTVEAVLGSVETLEFAGLHLTSTDEWRSPARLAEACNYCAALKSMRVNGMRLSDEGIKEFVDGLEDNALPELKLVDVSANWLTAQGITTLCEAFGRGVAPRLVQLETDANLYGDEGAKSFAAALRSGRLPKTLQTVTMGLNGIGDEGAKSLAAALHTSGSTCRMTLVCNCIGFAGYSAIIRALEARHGQELAHYISTAVMNAPYFLPRFLILSLSRGARFYQERGVIV